MNINRPDVIVLNETWLKKSVYDHEIRMDKNFNIFKMTGPWPHIPLTLTTQINIKKIGGVVLIAIKSDI